MKKIYYILSSKVINDLSYTSAGQGQQPNVEALLRGCKMFLDWTEMAPVSCIMKQHLTITECICLIKGFVQPSTKKLPRERALQEFLLSFATMTW